MKYEIKERIEIEDIDGSNIIIMENNDVITLNETASDIIDQIRSKKTTDEIVAILSKKYELDNELLEDDIKLFCDELVNKGVLNIVYV